METETDRTGDENKEETTDDKAAEQTTASGTAVAARRGLRVRGAGRPKSGVPTSQDLNGAASNPQISGRVLRDRATRSVPAWLKDIKSDDEDEPRSPDTSATKRRKVQHSRRKKIAEHSGEGEGDNVEDKDSSGDHKKPTADAQDPTARRPSAPIRAKTTTARASRGPAKAVCKTEPGTDTLTGDEVKANEKKSSLIEKGGEDVEEPVLDDEELSFEDDHNDSSYQPQALSGAEEGEALSSEEDVPYRDDLNDESYDPKAERDVPKPKRRLPPRQRDKKDKLPAKEVVEIKIEGSENAENAESTEEEVKTEQEARQVPEEPRKRGRRRKDDKTPRLPKRRKKPPVQYVRCEMEGCGTVLAHPRYLQHHIKYQHLLKKKYVCPHPSCGRLFRLQKQLLRHAKHHTDQRDYICEFCARAFKSSHNLAVHRMIHTGEKPLQCEICGFTCRQKASLNWHMKKHDADATYQFSCSICGKKFEKKDCVVAHKAKSHPEVLIAEALAANAGALITTPNSLLESALAPPRITRVEASQAGQAEPPLGPHQGEQVSQQVSQLGAVGQMSHQVVLLSQDQSLHTLQVPVTIALTSMDPPSPADAQQQQQTHLQLQMPLQFVHGGQQQQQQQQQQQPHVQQMTLHSGSVVSQPHVQQMTLHSGSVVSQHHGQLQQLQSYSSQQQQQQSQTQILHMTFQPVSRPTQAHIQQIPILAAATTSTQHLHTLQSAGQSQATSSRDGYMLSSSSPPPAPPTSADSLHQQTEAVAWQLAAQGEAMTDGTEGHMQQALI